MTQENDALEITVLDIGAWGGASPDWRVIGNFVRLIGFEPHEEECNRLNTVPASSVKMQTFYPYVISGESGKRDFYITRRPTVSSLLKPIEKEWKRYGIPGSSRNRRAEVINTIETDTITLDEFCDKYEVVPDFVKIDTQGSELEILRDGFQDNINHILGVEIEVEFVPLYKHQPLFSEIELFLRKKGFQIFGLKRHMWKMNDGHKLECDRGGRLVFGDALFLNENIFGGNLPREKWLKTALLAYRYGLHDVTQSILMTYGIDNDQFNNVLKRVRLRSGGLHHLRLSKYLRRLIQWQSHQGRGSIIEFDEQYGF